MPHFYIGEDKLIHWSPEDEKEVFTVVCPYSYDIDGIFYPTCNCSEEQQYQCSRDI